MAEVVADPPVEKVIAQAPDQEIVPPLAEQLIVAPERGNHIVAAFTPRERVLRRLSRSYIYGEKPRHMYLIGCQVVRATTE